MELTPSEQAWLARYKVVLNERFPGLVQDLIVFGSKARGDAHPDSDLDLVVVIGAGDWRLKDALACAAYDLAAATEVVPSLHVYTLSEWEALDERRSLFREAVEQDGISVR